jgi:hypothetical protein
MNRTELGGDSLHPVGVATGSMDSKVARSNRVHADGRFASGFFASL